MSSESVGSKARVKQLLTKVGAPLLNRIDGRVWNINWRVEYAWELIRGEGGLIRQSINDALHTIRLDVQDARHEVEASLDTYARSAEESSSYVATELRRIDAAVAAGADAQGQLVVALEEHLSTALAGIEARGLDALYRERLAHARDIPLADLDGDLAWLLNHAQGHRGFAAQADLWFNPPTTVEFSAGRAQLSGVNERIVEMPFAFGALGRLAPGSRVLDIGSSESTFALSAAALGHRVSAVDLRELPYQHPNLTSYAGRFEDWKAPRGKFAGAFLISTIEHVGIGGYGEAAYGGTTPGSSADRALIERLADLLAADGLLCLTTPFGTAGVNAFERTYDQAAIDTLLEGWTVLDQRVATSDGQVWQTEAAPRAGERGVVMILATPPRGA